jgi:hypothetical protein
MRAGCENDRDKVGHCDQTASAEFAPFSRFWTALQESSQARRNQEDMSGARKHRYKMIAT